MFDRQARFWWDANYGVRRSRVRLKGMTSENIVASFPELPEANFLAALKLAADPVHRLPTLNL
jgi:hypothetical protein